jgi:hypothetical protein
LRRQFIWQKQPNQFVERDIASDFADTARHIKLDRRVGKIVGGRTDDNIEFMRDRLAVSV